MTTSFEKIDQFQTRHTQLSLGKTPEQLKESHPTHNEVNGRIEDARKKALESLEGWQKTPRGSLGFIKQKLNPVGNFFRKMVGKPATTVAPKDAAAEPHKFEKITDEEKKVLEKKAKLYQTLSKVLLIVGAVLLGIGILGPLALTPLFFIIPEVIVLTIIATGTVIGVAGTSSMVAYPFLKNSNPIKEHRAKTDLDFQQFVERYVQAPKDEGGKDKGGSAFNLKPQDLNDTKLHKIYLDWKKEVDAVIDNDKKNAKLQEELAGPIV